MPPLVGWRFDSEVAGEPTSWPISHNGFLVGTGEEFLDLLKAQAATDPSKPHPWAIESFLASHPRALKFVQDPKPVPVSFLTESFYANNAFVFINSKGQKQVGRQPPAPNELTTPKSFSAISVLAFSREQIRLSIEETRIQVHMPPLEALFYYSVLCHETTHWTAAGHRLNRDLSGRSVLKAMQWRNWWRSWARRFSAQNCLFRPIRARTTLYTLPLG
jgi:hypothetical protein